MCKSWAPSPSNRKRQKQEKLKLKEGTQEERGEEGRDMGRKVKFFLSMETAQVPQSTASRRAAFSVCVCLSVLALVVELLKPVS